MVFVLAADVLVPDDLALLADVSLGREPRAPYRGRCSRAGRLARGAAIGWCRRISVSSARSMGIGGRSGRGGPLKSSADPYAAVVRRMSRRQAPAALERHLSFRSRRLGADLEIPVEDLLAGPEQHVALPADRLEDAAEIFGPVRCAHDVGMHRNRHDAGGALGVGVDLFELIDSAVVEFRRLVVLD